MEHKLTPSGEGNSIALKAYSTKELARIYGISTKTFRNWIKPFKAQLGERVGWYWNIGQVRIIFSKLDAPNDMETQNTAPH